jgi:hypothetical protein
MTNNTPKPTEHESAKDMIERAVNELLDLNLISCQEDVQRAYEILDRLMTLAYASGRADEAESRA